MLETATLIIVLTGAAHSWLGERYLLRPLFRRPDLPGRFGVAFTTGTLRFAWHLTTLAWWAIGALLWLASRDAMTTRAMLQVVGATALASAVLPIVFTRGRHLSWIAFLAIGALALGAA